MNNKNITAEYNAAKKLHLDACIKYGDSREVIEEEREKARKKLVRGIKNGTVPTEDFIRDEVFFNLWRNRNTDEPITSRELFTIVSSILAEIDSARSSAAWSNYSG